MDTALTPPFDPTRKSVDRPVTVFTVPAALRSVGRVQVEEIGIVELDTDEEMMATKRSRNDPVRLAFELARESLRWVKKTGAASGQAVTTADGSGDAVWAGVHPKVRQLIVTAYGVVHNPTDNELALFLASRQVQVG